MTMLFSILNLVIILIIIVFVFNMISKIRIPINKTWPVLILYLALLLISVPVFYAIAEPGQSMPGPGPNATGESSWVEYDSHLNKFYSAIYDNRLEEYEDATINRQWSFEYDQEHLLVTASGNQNYNAMIAVKQKDVHDGKVDVANYTAVSPFSKITVANPPEVRLIENRLEIIPPQPKHVEMVRFNHDFTFAQFTGEGLFMQSKGFFYHEQQVLYIQVPANLIIKTDNSTVHILNHRD
ncbi:MAG: hypothetical protein VR67_04755 [Peptococcaceae bacterium BRH_c8a]|nr:MAG: hypothetical protein VR67_04755 [Peptococcaceae bacterium BRH_c8a]